MAADSMKRVTEPAKRTPVLLEADVVVVGGGPAGIAAAVGSAKAGAKTVIIERYSCLGGNITIASVEPPSWYRQEKTTMPGGVQREIEERMIALGAVSKCIMQGIGLSYDTEVFKYMADSYVKEYGITPVYHCVGASPYVVDGLVKGVITESKSGRTAALAKRVIDCTGDADIVARAGAPCRKGDELTGRMQAGTLKFFATNVDIGRVEAAMDKDPGSRDPYVHKLLYQPFENAERAGEAPLQNSMNRIFYSAIPPCDININLATQDRDLDGTDVRSLTASEIKLRKEALEVLRRFRTYGKDEGLAEAKLRNFATAVGVRETRRIVADYTLTNADIYGKARFQDTVGVFPVYADGENVKEIPYTDAYFQIPFRILVPQGVDNLLAAGRCISCARDAVPTTRQMDFCMTTGQAAGAASALSIREGVSSRHADVTSLQVELQRQGLRVF
jgi:hypothetical protein